VVVILRGIHGCNGQPLSFCLDFVLRLLTWRTYPGERFASQGGEAPSYLERNAVTHTRILSAYKNE
jgi:hypothetical protein